MRLLLFGRNHLEVDIAGAFYEIVRRIELRGGGAREVRLPHIAQMRIMLERELSTQQPCCHVMPIINKALHIAMNAPVSTALQYITKQGLHHPCYIQSSAQRKTDNTESFPDPL